MLASGEAASTPHTQEWLAAAPMIALIEDLRAAHDYVIVDLPPLVPVVDARATGHFIDRYILVVEWGGTRIETVKNALVQAPELQERLLGVVINKAEIKSLKRYERDFARFDHVKYASRYGPPEARPTRTHKQGSTVVDRAQPTHLVSQGRYRDADGLLCFLKKGGLRSLRSCILIALTKHRLRLRGHQIEQ